MQVADLARYNHVVRGLYYDALAKMSWKEVVEPLGLSFDSLRDVFLHLTLVEDRWINYIIRGRFKEWTDLNFDNFKNIEDLKNYVKHVRDGTESYFKTLTADELNRQVIIPWGDKPGTLITVETALTHMVIEDMIHYGELSAALWQKGLEAPYFGFWRFKQAHV